LWLPHWATDQIKIASRRAEATTDHRRPFALREPRLPWGAGSSNPNAEGRPLVTIAALGGRAVLAAVDAAGAAAGLEPGMALADARALIPDLAVRLADPASDAAALARLADWCSRYSPWVAVDGADGLFIDITGCAHLFGGEAALLADLGHRLGRLGYGVRLALADTPGAAWAAARFAEPRFGADGAAEGAILPPDGTREAIAGLPVAALRLGPALAAELERLGLKTVGDLYPLPRAALMRRFGPEPGRRLDQALGRVEEPINPRLPASPREARLAFAEPVIEAEGIAASLDRLLTVLCRHLAAEELGARRLRLALYRVDGSLQRFTVGTSRPNRDAMSLRRLFADALERVDPGFGIEAMVLTAEAAEPLDPLQMVLAEAGAAAPSAERSAPEAAATATATASAAAVPSSTVEPIADTLAPTADPVALAALADRFANGREPAALRRAALRESHLPERAVLEVPAFARAPGFWPDAPRRPVRLLARPEPVETEPASPETLPASFRWRARSHQVRMAEGPERIALEWWRPAAPPGSRDYYRVEDSEGRRFWLYRDEAAARW
jgi:protein ImuB